MIGKVLRNIRANYFVAFRPAPGGRRVFRSGAGCSSVYDLMSKKNITMNNTTITGSMKLNRSVNEGIAVATESVAAVMMANINEPPS